MLINKNRKIKNFIIYPKLQLPLILLNSLIIIFFVFLTELNHSYNFYIAHRKASELGLNLNSQFEIFLSSIETSFCINSLILGATTLIFGIIATIIISHKIAGPIYRMHEYYSKKKLGENVDDLKFRDNDYLIELADLINSSVEQDKINNSQNLKD